MIGNQKSIYYLRFFSDLFVLNLSFIISAVLAQSLPILVSRPYMLVLMAVLNFIWYFFSNVTGFYQDVATRSYSYQFAGIIKNIFAQIITAVLFIFIAKEDLFTRNFILFYAFLLFFCVSARIQIIKHLVIRIRGREKNLKNVIIIGSGELGKSFRNLIDSRRDFGYNFLGFLDESVDSENNEIIGTIGRLEEIINYYKTDVVVIALSIYASGQLDEIIKICNRNAQRIHIIPDYFRFLSKKYQVNMIGDFPIITVRDEPLAEAHWRFIKRTVDIFLSIFIIVIIFPWLFPLLYLINKMTSSGNLLFIQERVGRNDKFFKCYKFRTMKPDNKANKEFNPTLANDPRVTKFGKFLRKSNIDELPQFINVLKGQMSIVGPRPHYISFHNFYKEMVDEIKIRSWVKPGITGWAQVHGLRGDVIDPEENKKRTIKRIEYDLWYIENWSLWLDIQIILLTIWQMIKGDTKGV
ncbi:MAG TPA: exopolysaccharide biosynthesis polyprenyl glycosylphosphotransferase [Ignavibacteriaceae bacterium]|nr:exopolysaccharide biosynthesis polyprenyl glycosylphosphotransferase [Ignavibacteriaceae bacterium]